MAGRAEAELRCSTGMGVPGCKRPRSGGMSAALVRNDKGLGTTKAAQAGAGLVLRVFGAAWLGQPGCRLCINISSGRSPGTDLAAGELLALSCTAVSRVSSRSFVSGLRCSRGQPVMPSGAEAAPAWPPFSVPCKALLPSAAAASQPGALPSRSPGQLQLQRSVEPVVFPLLLLAGLGSWCLAMPLCHRQP